MSEYYIEDKEPIPFEVEDPEFGKGMTWLYALFDKIKALPYRHWIKHKFEHAAKHASYAGREPFLKSPRNDPCPCGSGIKTKKCGCQAYSQQVAGSEPNPNLYKKR